MRERAEPEAQPSGARACSLPSGHCQPLPEQQEVAEDRQHVAEGALACGQRGSQAHPACGGSSRPLLGFVLSVHPNFCFWVCEGAFFCLPQALVLTIHS